MYLLLHIQVKCEQLLLEHLQGLKCTCRIHEVEVDTIRKDNLSLFHNNVLFCFNLVLCYFRTTVASVMLINLFIIIHLN